MGCSRENADVKLQLFLVFPGRFQTFLHFHPPSIWAVAVCHLLNHMPPARRSFFDRIQYPRLVRLGFWR